MVFDDVATTQHDVVMSDRLGVRELKASLSASLRRVSQGESIVITDRGRPVARLVPPDVPEGLARLLRAGRLHWSARRAHVPRTRPALRGRGPSLSEIVLRDRG